jgi:hypothetical protein
LEDLGKKLTDDPDGTVKGVFSVVLYDDHFKVLTTENLGIDDVYILCATVMDYLENVADDLDKVNKIMLQ